MLKLFRTPVKIFHMASMPRCGETLLLRTLNAHSQLRAVHNLRATDSVHELALFEFLKTFNGKKLRRSHPLLKPYCLHEDEHLIFKQSVWNHEHPFRGFVLTRNPISVYASLVEYGRRNATSDPWQPIEERIERWMSDIEPDKKASIKGKTPIEQFAMLYNARMGHLSRRELPVLFYENFVISPAGEIRSLLRALGLPFQQAILTSHSRYSEQSEGHGDNSLSSEINRRSLLKYTRIISQTDFQEVKSLTDDTSSQFGYECVWGSECRPSNNAGGVTAKS
ncbi:sulfotransferase domain-containing protein [Roseimaritima ulvae]|uniref:Sulfotransferase domain-containing protein n=1 Tax=Roseimaritima ulvae TaxID=980254 RepID=A0A5B9QYL2_9BACT|nr:sulfotransferase domain-containing protein [Roseimaritima ulvae]QEG42485.1 hypothetical protein UC8_45240 [Roseimaritima ulvae]